MSNVALILGPVAFEAFEIPERITFGGAQRLAVHRLIGGAHVIDALGRDDAQIEFSGVFSGSDATLRARAVDELRIAGLPVPLTWDCFFFTVFVERLETEYRAPWWIPFRIRCAVLRDEAAVLVDEVASLATSVAADIGSAFGLAGQIGFDLSRLQGATQNSGSFTRGTWDYGSLMSELDGSASNLASQRDAASLALDGISATEFTDVPSAISTINQAAAASQSAATLSVAAGFLGRAMMQLSQAST